MRQELQNQQKAMIVDEYMRAPTEKRAREDDTEEKYTEDPNPVSAMQAEAAVVKMMPNKDIYKEMILSEEFRTKSTPTPKPLSIPLPDFSFEGNNTIIIWATLPSGSERCCFNICPQAEDLPDALYHFNPRVTRRQVLQSSRFGGQVFFFSTECLHLFCTSCTAVESPGRYVFSGLPIPI